MSELAKSDLSIQHHKSLNNNEIMVSNVQFKEKEDLELTNSKLSDHSGIASVYYNEAFSEMVQQMSINQQYLHTMNEIASITSNKEQFSQINQQYCEKQKDEIGLLQKITDDNNNDDIDEPIKKEVENIHILDGTHINQFIQLCTSSTFRTMISKMREESSMLLKELLNAQQEDIEELNKQYSEEIEQIASNKGSESDINQKLQQHVKLTDDKKVIYQQQLQDLSLQRHSRLIDIINDEYKSFILNKQAQKKDVRQNKDGYSKQNNELSNNDSNQEKIQSYSAINVMLGQQIKFPFNIEIQYNNLSDFFSQQNSQDPLLFNEQLDKISALGQKLQVADVYRSSTLTDKCLEFLNPFYGIMGTGFLNLVGISTNEANNNFNNTGNISVKKNSIDDPLREIFNKYTLDLHFVPQDIQLQILSKQYQKITDGDILLTYHSNFGYLNTVINISTSTLAIKDQLIQQYINDAIFIAAQKKLAKLIIPIEILDKKRFSQPNFDQKKILESLNHVIEYIKTAIQSLAFSQPKGCFLKTIQILLPKILNSSGDNTQFLEKCKEKIRKKFE